MIEPNNQRGIPHLTPWNRVVFSTIAITLGIGAFTEVALANSATKLPPVFSFRFTDIKAVEDDPEGDKFQLSFEVLNWTDRPAGGVRVALNAATITGDGSAASFAGAGIDNNGRPLGSSADPLPGNQLFSNIGKVVESTNTTIQWDASQFDFNTFTSGPIPNRDLLGVGPNNTPGACALVPGCQVVGSSNPFFGTPVVNDLETVDNGNNVLDGFVITVDDFDELEAISFNWNLLDVNGNPLGNPVGGNAASFGTVNLTRLRINNDDTGATFDNKNILFPQNTGFRQTSNVFAQNSYRVTEFSNTTYDTLIAPGTSPLPNVAPTITEFDILAPMPFEGQAAYAYIDATDPGADVLSFYINGEYIGNDTDTSGTRSISKNLGIFEDSGTFSYTAQVRDDDGGTSSTVTRSFNIRNLPPTLLLDSPFPTTVNEGDSVLLSLSATDPGKDAIDFLLNGEVIGTDNSTSGTRTFSENLNLFSDDGTFDYRIEARDDDNGYSNTFFRNVTVNNVAPTFDFDIPTINEGESALALFNATDPGSDAISFFLNDEKVATDSRTSGTRSFSHDLGLFDDDGIFTYTAFARDDDGAESNVITKKFEVKNVAPIVTDITKDFEIYPEQLFDFAVAATDPGKDKLTYHWDFDGDGSYNDYIRDSGKWSFSDPGDYTVGVKISDGDGGVTYDSFKVAVKPIKPPYSFRFTDIKGVEGDPDKFHFEFEVANWTDKEVGGVYVALTDKPQGKKFEESPFFDGAGIDINGRPYGPGRDPIPGTPNQLNTGTVVDESESAIEWTANPLISPSELTDIDSRKNVLDGFVFSVDDFDVEEFISFNWFLLDENGAPIGTAGSGSEYGFGTVDLVRLASTGSQDNFDQLPLSKLPDVFYDDVNQVTDKVTDTVAFRALGKLGLVSSSLTAPRTFNKALLPDSNPLFGGRVETGLTAQFLNVEDNKFNAPINVSLNPVEPEDIPEPSTLLGMFAFAAASLFGLKRRR